MLAELRTDLKGVGAPLIGLIRSERLKTGVEVVVIAACAIGFFRWLF